MQYYLIFQELYLTKSSCGTHKDFLPFMCSIMNFHSVEGNTDLNGENVKNMFTRNRRGGYTAIYEFMTTNPSDIKITGRLIPVSFCPVDRFMTWWTQITQKTTENSNRKIPLMVRHDYLTTYMPVLLRIKLAQDLYNLYCEGYSSTFGGRSRPWIIPTYSAMKSINPEISNDEINTIVNIVKNKDHGNDKVETFAEKCAAAKKEYQSQQQ